MRIQRGMLLALAVVAPVLGLGAGADRWSFGLAAPPFGWISLAGVHMLATLPLALLLGTRLQARVMHLSRARSQTVWGVLWLSGAIAILALSIQFAPAVESRLGSSSAGFVGHFAMRFVWSLALLLPWCLLFAACGRAGEKTKKYSAPALHFSLYAAVAVGVPWIFTRHLERQQAELARELLARGNYAQAQVPVLGLCDIGSSQPINGELPQTMARELSARTNAYLASLAIPLSRTATDGERIARAQAHAQFGQLEAARAELRTLAKVNVAACLLVAATWQEEENFAESTRYYSQARSMARGNDAESAIRAIDGLAFNARAAGKHAEAAAYYEAGLEEYPRAAAHFHFQLAHHYQLGGRPWLAAEHFELAASLDPEQFRQASDRQLAQLRLTTPACLPMTWRPGGTR